MAVSQVIQPAQQNQVATKGQQQQFRGQPTFFLINDNQHAAPSRPCTFTLTPMKHFNPSSVASTTGQESQHNISGLSSFFGNIPSGHCRSTHCSHFHQLTHNHQPPLLQLPLPHSNNISSHQPSLNLIHSQPMPNSRSKTTAIASNRTTCKQLNFPFQDYANLPKNNQPLSKKFPKQKALHRSTQNTLAPNTKQIMNK